MPAVDHVVWPVVVTAEPDGLSAEVAKGALWVKLMVERDGQVSAVDAGYLSQHQISFEELRVQAVDNLRELAREDEWQSVDTVPGMHLLLPSDTLASSRLLATDSLVGSWPLGGIVAACPSPDQLLCVPLHTVEDLEAVRIMATAVHYAHAHASEPLSDQVFWNDGTKWHHIQVRHGLSEVEIVPGAEFLETVNRLASVGMYAVAGEA